MEWEWLLSDDNTLYQGWKPESGFLKSQWGAFSEGPTTILLRHGTLTTLETFEHRAESYAFTAGIYVDREALTRRNEAQVLIRPSLRVHDAAVSLKLFEDAALVIRSTDRHGVGATMEIRGLELSDDRETVVPFQVPDDLAGRLEAFCEENAPRNKDLRF